MFDARLRPIIDPLLDRLGRGLARLGVTANQATLLAALCGAAAGIAIAFSHFNWGLALIVASRVLDGLDGAIARATRPTDFGGFLDIVGDYVFYIAVPVGFGLASPDNAVGAISLLAAFTLTGISFMALATLAAKRGLDISTHGAKSFFYSGGLTEGAETIAVFVFACLWPQYWTVAALVFSGLCAITVVQRVAMARRLFGEAP